MPVGMMPSHLSVVSRSTQCYGDNCTAAWRFSVKSITYYVAYEDCLHVVISCLGNQCRL